MPVGVPQKSTICKFALSTVKTLALRETNSDALTYVNEFLSFRYCRPSCLYYLSTLNRLVLRKDHSRCQNSTICQAHQMDTKTYKPQHVVGCPGCEEDGLSSKAISNVLVSDKVVIPLITVDFRRPHCPVEMVAPDIIKFERVLPYVAISHVWSDGKGNPQRNFLPACQLQRIQDHVNALYPSDAHPIPFWMDTLCVPVGRKFWPIRNIALNRMKTTYRSAEKILVLDTSLEFVDSTVDPTEAKIRIQYSPWSTRLWTLHESRLGLNIYFQFRDKSRSFDHLPRIDGDNGNLHVVNELLKSITTPELVSLIRPRCLVNLAK